MKEIFPRVFLQNRKLYTVNLVKDSKVYGEKLIQYKGMQLREWDPFRSKLGAAILKGIKLLPIQPKSVVLYLGAAEGTTPSHVADIVGEEGVVFCIDNAPRVMPKLMKVAEIRENMLPILADANHPEEYAEYCKDFDINVVYMDVAQPNQAEIMVKNAKKYLKKGAFGLLALKARSVDSTKPPAQIFKETKQILEKTFKVIQVIDLEPYEKDHVMFVLEKK